MQQFIYALQPQSVRQGIAGITGPRGSSLNRGLPGAVSLSCGEAR